MNSSFISVVMSVYNGEKYLAEAIESILNQTYKNFELIIINDGSKDNSVEIIKNYMKQDNRIVLIDRENKGLPYSLNEAISIAKGEYIARMDADDISLPTRFEKQIDYMQKNELDVCGSYIKIFGDNRKERIIKNPITNEDIRFSLLFFSCLAHPTVMFKKEVFDKVKYRVDYKVAQDYQLWCDIVNADFKIGNIPEVLLNYREHEAQASIEKFKRQQDTAHKIALDYAKNLGKEEINLVNQIITSKKTIGFKGLKELFDDIKNYANEKNIQNDLIFYILKKIYIDSNPKSPMKYFLYRKATKNSDKKFKEEMNMFFKSFVIFSRDSMIYQFLKKLKNKGIQ
ncbi:glycosyltransferase family 2 protein [Aliarcobacter cryaerophilus]|uniref:glycosyltransferase family 2 protein n=1 Tax=Aliarcobacter cryaerophilus TaxID=28198 RepID=UPI0021B56DB1|nr:glycosyltransferase family 2 protein [Aliarcobacter cryaerophilus]MCT7481732.1 glycosyltransferase [Aliarcobacter cryaerophilus]